MSRLTVYLCIGNSDDKLSQVEWADFQRALLLLVATAPTAHGVWYSAPGSKWQNMCVCVEIELRHVHLWWETLHKLAGRFRQDSISWAEVDHTKFLGPPPPLPVTEPGEVGV